MEGKICHIMVLDKFIPPYINFIDKYFDINNHHFIIFADSNTLQSYPITQSKNITFINQKYHFKISKLFYIVCKLQSARKIFIHGLWIHHINIILTFMFWNLKKCYLAIWGGGIYIVINLIKRQKNILKKKNTEDLYLRI